MAAQRPLRIGNGAGFWGDDVDAPVRLVQRGALDCLTLEYLAELTLSILAYQKSKRPEAGYVSDFPVLIKRLAGELVAQPNLKVVTNAGGMNAVQCAVEVSRNLADTKLASMPIASIGGDDIKPRLAELESQGADFTNFDDGRSFDEVRDRIVSANVYLGAKQIRDACRDGARVVITGRVADASLVVGPAWDRFGWSEEDWSAFGKATVAGHLIECGAQVTGGIDSTWDESVDLSDLGYPIAEMDETGDCVITKPAGSGGRVNSACVAEQLVYEIGDPRRYLTPDVTADFSQVTLESAGVDRVQVRGGRGTARPDKLKVSMAYRDGYMASGTIVLVGTNAIGKARYAGQLIEKRLKQADALPERFHTEVLGGDDSSRGAVHTGQQPWDVVLRICGRDADRERLNRMVRELAPLVTSGPPGVTGYTGARPKPHPVFAYWPALIPREFVEARRDVKTVAEWCQSASGSGE